MALLVRNVLGVSAPSFMPKRELGVGKEAERDMMFEAMARVGVRYLRVDFLWTDIEPRRGEFFFTAYDELVAAASRYGIELIGIICYGNPWATSAASKGANYKDYGLTDKLPPDDLETYANFAAAVASRYRGQVRRWEIWNEPNVFVFWQPRPNPVRYGDLLKTTYARIKEVAPESIIVSGGLAPYFDIYRYGRNWGFLKALFRAHPDIGGFCDAIAFHPYTFLQRPAPETRLVQSFPAMIRRFRGIAEEIGAGFKPLWATEFGWHTAVEKSGYPGFPRGVDEETQAAFLVRSFTLALAEGVEVVSWYTLLDGVNARRNKEWAFGLFNPLPQEGVPTPKPAYHALRTFSEVLGNATAVPESLNLPRPAYGYRFSLPGRSVAVLWSVGERAVQLTLRSRARATVRGLLGENLFRTDSEETCFRLSNRPIYLVE